MSEISVCIAFNKFKNLVNAISHLSISLILQFDRILGIKGQVIHPEHNFYRDFQITPCYFTWHENYERIAVNEPINLPINLGYLLSSLEKLSVFPKIHGNSPNLYSLKISPSHKTLQSIQEKSQLATDLIFFKEETCVVQMPKKLTEIFPAVNSETYPYLLSINKSEFDSQIGEHLLMCNDHIQIGIIGNKLYISSFDEGMGNTVTPCKKLNQAGEHGEISPGYLSSFNEAESDPHVLKSVRQFMKDNKENGVPGNQFIEEKEHGEKGAGKGIVQCFNSRFLTFLCKSKHDATKVIIGMSPWYGLVLLLPMTSSMTVDQLELNENCYFRYKFKPLTNYLPNKKIMGLNT